MLVCKDMEDTSCSAILVVAESSRFLVNGSLHFRREVFELEEEEAWLDLRTFSFSSSPNA